MVNCGAWSADNTLVLGSSDKSLNFLSADGEVITDEIEIEAEPFQLEFCAAAASSKTDKTAHKIAANIDGKALVIHNPSDGTRAKELSFDKNEGYIQRVRWISENDLIVAFTSGTVSGLTCPRDLHLISLNRGKSHQPSRANSRPRARSGHGPW